MERAYRQQDEQTVTICLDEMGPIKATTYPGQSVVRPHEAGPGPGDHLIPRGRSVIELDYGYRGSCYVFGAFIPKTGEAFTADYTKRQRVQDWLDFLLRVERWLPAEFTRVLAILDNANTHHHRDVLLFMAVFPRWEFVFIPRYAGYLNLIEPWWATLRSLALEGKRFENVDELLIAIERGTRYWNEHKHPYVFGKARRRKTPRKPGVARLPGHRLTA